MTKILCVCFHIERVIFSLPLQKGSLAFNLSLYHNILVGSCCTWRTKITTKVKMLLSIITYLNVLSVPTDRANLPDGWIERKVTCPLKGNQQLALKLTGTWRPPRRKGRTHLCALIDFRHSHFFASQTQMSPSSAPLIKCLLPWNFRQVIVPVEKQNRQN